MATLVSSSSSSSSSSSTSASTAAVKQPLLGQAERRSKAVQIRKQKRGTVLSKRRFQAGGSGGGGSGGGGGGATIDSAELSNLLSAGLTSSDADENLRSLVALRNLLESSLPPPGTSNNTNTNSASGLGAMVHTVATLGGFPRVIAGLARHGRPDVQGNSAAVLALLVAEDAPDGSADGRAVSLLGSHPHSAHETVSLLMGLLTMRHARSSGNDIRINDSATPDERARLEREAREVRRRQAAQLLDMRECAAWCLGNLAADSSELRGAIISAGGVLALVDTVRRATPPLRSSPSSSSSSSALSHDCDAPNASYQSQALVQQSIYALANLCRGAPLAPAAGTAAVAELSRALCEFLMAHEGVRRDAVAAADACHGLHFLSRGADEQSVQLLIAHGALSSKSLAKLILDPPTAASSAALFAPPNPSPPSSSSSSSSLSVEDRMAMSGGSVCDDDDDDEEEQQSNVTTGDAATATGAVVGRGEAGDCGGGGVSGDDVATAAFKVLGNLAAGTDEQTGLVAASAARAEVGWLRKLAPLLQRGTTAAPPSSSSSSSSSAAAAAAAAATAAAVATATTTTTTTGMAIGAGGAAFFPNRALKREVCWLVANLAAVEASALKLVARPHGPALLAALVDALGVDKETWAVRRECLFAVSNLIQTMAKIANKAPPGCGMRADGSSTSSASSSSGASSADAAVGSVQLLLDYCALPPLVAMLEVSDAEVVASSLQALHALLALSEHRHSAAVRERCGYFKGLVDEAGGADMLVQLQQHPNENIYAAAVNLLERYFDGGDDGDNDDDVHGQGTN